MNGLRFTVRFRADNEAERRAAEHLKSLRHGEQNRFLVRAVLSAIGDNPAATPECVRQIVREELASALSAFTTPPAAAPEQKHDAPSETQEQDDLSVLDDLELFDCRHADVKFSGSSEK